MTYVSHADLGGRTGYGPVVPEAEGDLFHAAWEPRALAVSLAMGATGSWNIDMGRAARETLPDYANLSYYEIWTHALQRLVEERHLADADEIEAGRMLRPGPSVKRVLYADDVPSTLAGGSPTVRPSVKNPRFAVGERVRARAAAVPHHTRLPGYVRGHTGLIERIHGAHVFADTHAQGLGEQPQFLYTVVFDGAQLWPAEGSRADSGEDAETDPADGAGADSAVRSEQASPGGRDTRAALTVSVDAWESYLEPL